MNRQIEKDMIIWNIYLLILFEDRQINIYTSL